MPSFFQNFFIQDKESKFIGEIILFGNFLQKGNPAFYNFLFFNFFSINSPTLDQYLDMIDKKTTGLFGLSVRLMQLFADSEKDYLPLIKLIGKYFQIRDDYANLKFDEVSFFVFKKTFVKSFNSNFSTPTKKALLKI